METTKSSFRVVAAATMADPRLQKALEGVYNGFHKNRIAAASETDRWDEQRDQGRAIKAHTIANLDYYLDLLATNVEKNGGSVFFANDVAEANAYVLALAQKHGVKTVIKSKSMVSEEMGLNHVFEANGIESVETDLGEYIIQLAKEPPYHIIAPAIHKSREQVADLLAPKSGGKRVEEIAELTQQAREQLRPVFQRADMGVTGVNFAVAESGSIVLVTNEGNGEMVTSAPRVHVACMGMEKVVPSVSDLALFLRILIRSATGQRISNYVSVVSGPRRSSDEDGPDEFHLVIVDNGRRKLLADPALREALYCIRCGACMNACPVYRKVGGHSYGGVYPGPIGAVVTPVMTGLGKYKELPFASSLCGACREVCPVRIDLPRMLLELRSQAKEETTSTPAGASPQPRDESKRERASVPERLVWAAWKQGMTGRRRFDLGAKVAKLMLRPLARGGWVRKVPGPLSGWTSSRDFPLPAAVSFTARYRKRRKARQAASREKSDG